MVAIVGAEGSSTRGVRGGGGHHHHHRGAVGRGRLGEVGEGLVVGTDGAAGVGEGMISRIDVVVVGIHGGDAVCTICLRVGGMM